MAAKLHPHKFDPSKDIGDLKGKVALVTGGNSGIGYHTVHQLALHGAKVYLGARNEGRANDAIERAKKDGMGSGSIEWLEIDLSSAQSAKKGAELLLEKEERLDILINNAGLLARDWELSDDGIVTTVATNHIGPFVLTTTLLPLLEKTAQVEGSDVRIVNVGSEGYKLAPKDLKFENRDDFNIVLGGSPMKKMSRYGVSKLCNVLYGPELQRRLDAKGSPIVVVTLHPGAVASEGAQVQLNTLPWPIPQVVWPILRMMFLSPYEGAITTLYAATSPDIKASPADFKGRYMVPFGKITELNSKDARSEELAKQLWETTERVVSEDLAKSSGPAQAS